METRNSRRRWMYVAGCVLITCAFAAMRAWVYASAAARSESWWLRDAEMTIPRLACLVPSLALGLAGWGRRGMGFITGGARTAVPVGIATVLVACLSIMTHGAQHASAFWWIVFSVTTLVVATLEEVLFRGAWLNALRDLWGNASAIVGSSLVFMLSHIQAQPLRSWPHILLFGLIWASMRVVGVSMAWLIGIHWLIDVLMLAGAAWSAADVGIAVLQLLLLTGLLWWQHRVAWLNFLYR